LILAFLSFAGVRPSLLARPVVIDASAVVEYVGELTLTDVATRLFHLAAGGRVELWAGARPVAINFP